MGLLQKLVNLFTKDYDQPITPVIDITPTSEEKLFDPEKDHCPICGKSLDTCEYFKRLETEGDED